jgi:hypothetical protein
MTSDHHLQRTAQTLIDRHGDDALRVATDRAAAAAAQGDPAASRDWRAIAAKIRELRTLAVPFSIC